MLPNKDANFGTEINGKWSGMTGELQRKVKTRIYQPKDYKMPII